MSTGADVSLARRGIVYLTYTEGRGGRPPFTGYWEQEEPPASLEEGPGWDVAADAIAWARERSPRVLIRFGAGEDSMYSAGEIRLQRSAAEGGLPFPEWPPAA